MRSELNKVKSASRTWPLDFSLATHGPSKILSFLKNFFFQEVSPLPLSSLRIFIAALIMIQGAFIFRDLQEYYGSQGYIQQELYDYLNSSLPYMPKISAVAKEMAPYGISFKNCVSGIFAFYMTSLFFLLVGCWTRFFAFCAWMTHFTLMNSSPAIVYGADRIHHIYLLYFIIFPVGETLSLDRAFSPSTPSNTSTLTPFMRTMGLRLMQVHLCLIYGESGIAKIPGFMWWNGEAIWRSIMGPGYQQFNFSWMAAVPWVALLAGYSTLIVEIFYPIFIWPRKTRKLWVYLTLLLHLGIAFFQGLWIFAMTMMVLNISLFLFDNKKSIKA